MAPLHPSVSFRTLYSGSGASGAGAGVGMGGEVVPTLVSPPLHTAL